MRRIALGLGLRVRPDQVRYEYFRDSQIAKGVLQRALEFVTRTTKSFVMAPRMVVDRQGYGVRQACLRAANYVVLQGHRKKKALLNALVKNFANPLSAHDKTSVEVLGILFL